MSMTGSKVIPACMVQALYGAGNSTISGTSSVSGRKSHNLCYGPNSQYQVCISHLNNVTVYKQTL